MDKNKMTAKGIAQTATIHCKEGKREVELVIEKAIKEYHQARLSELKERVEKHKRRLQSTKDTTRDAMEYKVYDASVESLKYVLSLIEQMQE